MMIKKLRLVPLVALLAAFITGHAYAQTPAPAAPPPSVRAEVGNPLKAAEALMAEKKPAEAMAKIAEAEKVANRTAQENYFIDRMRAGAALGLGDDALAFKSLVAAFESGLLTAEETPRIVDAVARIAFRSKDYPNAIIWGERTMKLPGANPDIRNLLASSHYLNKDYASAIRELTAIISETEARGTKVSEDRLRMLAASANQIKDDKTYYGALEKLAVNYPKTEYWADLIYRVESAPNFSDRLTLDTYRLKLAAGVMKSQRDFLDMANMLSAGALFSEAQKVIDAANAAGKWSGGADDARAKKLADTVSRDLKDEQARGNTTPPRTSVAYLNNGMDQVVKGNAQKGLEYLEQSVKLPDQKRPDEARLRLGIGHMLAGDRAKAEETFKAVRGSEGLTELARAWLLFAQSGAK